MKDDLSEFGPERDYIAAIERTAKEMSTPTRIDTKVLAEKAARAYWAARDQAHEQGRAANLPAYEKTTAELARAVAARMGYSNRRPGKAFLIEALCAFLPALIFSSVIYVIFWRNGGVVDPAAQAALKWAIGATALLCSLGYLAIRYGKLPRVFRFVPNPGGALLGGFISVCLLSALVFSQAKRTEALSMDLAQKEVSDLVLSTMERMLKGEEISEASYQKDNISLSTEIKSKTEVEYTAALEHMPGLLVAQVSPERGTLYWKYENGQMIEAEFVVGKVIKEEKEGFLLQSSDGPTIWVGSGNNIVDKPKPGDHIIVVIDTEHFDAIMIREIGS